MKSLIFRLSLASSLALLATQLTACGQKGPLYLPAKPASAPAAKPAPQPGGAPANSPASTPASTPANATPN